MKNVTIISHLTPQEWRNSWDAKVVYDSKENKNATRSQNCFWGHFDNDTNFTICFHKEFEIKGMSLSQYFRGRIEEDPQGTKITGSFGKKLSANLFLGLGAVLCIMAMIGAQARHEPQVMFTALILMIVLMLFYFIQPRKGQEKILEELKRISFDDKFHHKKIMANPKKLKKQHKNRSMRDKAKVDLPDEIAITDPETPELNVIETADGEETAAISENTELPEEDMPE